MLYKEKNKSIERKIIQYTKIDRKVKVNIVKVDFCIER